MPTIDRASTVAQIVLDHPVSARVFLEHRIDFCCRGGLTVEQACAGKGVDAEAVFAELERAVLERAAPTDDPRQLSTARLIDHIVGRHHDYLRQALPLAEQIGRKVARVHGERNPKLPSLASVITELREALEPHLDAEERSLFPALMSPVPDSKRIAQELRSMHEDHLRVGELLTCMRTLADEYVVPDWACGSYQVLLRELEAIEVDTFRHVHLENHVLMPRFAAVDAPEPHHVAAEREGLGART